MQKKATHPPGSSTSTTRITPAGRSPGRHERLVPLLRRLAVELERPRSSSRDAGRLAWPARCGSPRRSAACRAARPRGARARVHSAASLRSRLTTVIPSDIAGLRNGALAYAPSATTQSGLPRYFSHGVAHRSSSTAMLQLGLELGPMLAGRCGQVLRRTYSRANSGRAIDCPTTGWTDQEPEHDQDVAVDMWRAGRAGGRVVMDAGSLDERPVPLRRRVVERQGEPRPVGDQGLDYLADQDGRRSSLAFLPAAATVV